MKKELSDAIHRFNLINKSKSQLADWNLIRKALSGSGQNSAEKTQPSGETNTTKVQICPKCEDGVIRVGRSQDYDTAICWWCNGSGKL